MKGVGTMIAVLVIAIGLLGAVGVTHYATASTGVQEQYTESFDPGTNQTHVTLNQSNQTGVYYTDVVNVTGENDSRMRPGIDYRWHSSNGTLTVLDGGNLDGDTSATIEYSLRIPSEQQKTYTTLLGNLFNATYAIPIVAAIALLVAALSLFTQLS